MPQTMRISNRMYDWFGRPLKTTYPKACWTRMDYVYMSGCTGLLRESSRVRNSKRRRGRRQDSERELQGS